MDAGGAVVDTSILIDHFRSRQRNNSILYRLAEKHILFISSVTQFEFLVGSKPEQMEQIKKIIDVFEILPFDASCVEIACKSYKLLVSKHQHPEFRDIFIAATAISNKIPLATLNTKHFKQINDLNLLNFKAL